ncbi:MAG: pyruvate dehydrogenase complex dihydrolipoamide acetyltransferase [Alphaproteobacteria bacterium]
MATQILMPALSPTMEEGKLAKWHVKEGDTVKPGDVLAEIETDKATMEFEAIDEGKIGKILVPEGAEGVKVNQPIAVLLGEGESAKDVNIAAAVQSVGAAVEKQAKKPEAASKSPSPLEGEGGAKRRVGGVAPIAPSPLPEARERASTLPQGEGGKIVQRTNGHDGGQRVFASPLARRVAQQAGIDITALKGSGPRGRIVKADVEAAAKPGKAPAARARAPGLPPTEAPSVPSIAPLPDARLFYKEDEYEAIPHDSIRKSIARRLASAKTLIPHYYLTIECDIGQLMETRARLNAVAPKEGEGAYKLSVNDFVIKAAALALLRVREVNASWTDTAILRHKHADIGVAVALDFGLITPIIFRAEEKGLAQISDEMKALAERARAKKLKPQEFEGGSFAISNLGMYGVKEFTAVINPPHAAILAIGAGESRPVVRDGKVVPASMMSVTMSCDHRVVDGATGARFLQAFRAFVEEPAAMLL